MKTKKNLIFVFAMSSFILSAACGNGEKDKKQAQEEVVVEEVVVETPVQMPNIVGVAASNENFTTLHDLALYILVPMINGGKIDYKHPIVEAATKLSIAISENSDETFGNYGQNRLYLFQKL